MSRLVVVVTGPPCAGKTTWVAERAQPGDIVLDADDIGERAMRQRLDQVAAMSSGRAFVIRCAPTETARQELAARLRADEVVLLRPDDDVLLARARARERPHRHVQAVRHWLAVEAGRQPASRAADPAPRPGTWW